jgi:hypothetical protein
MPRTTTLASIGLPDVEAALPAKRSVDFRADAGRAAEG